MADRTVTDSAATDRSVATGRPVGRRIVLGMLGLGVLGVAFGDHLQDLESDFLRPLEEHDPTGLSALIPAGDTFRFYSITGDEPQRTSSALTSPAP